jgi:nucleotide-binding universal stress UspA family protein
MYDTILVPLDGTSFAEQALRHALSIARRAKAEIALASVDEVLPVELADVDGLGQIRDARARYLDALVERIRASGVTGVSSVVLTGAVADQLETYRTEIGAGLTVMSTHGRGPLSRAWLGSVADRLSRATAVPIMLVRPEADDAAEVDLASDVELGDIVVPIDGSPLSESALEPATALGLLFGASYTLLRFVAFPHLPPSVYMPDIIEENRRLVEEMRPEAESQLQTLASGLEARGLAVSWTNGIVTNVATSILEVAEARNADLIAMASHGRGGIRRMTLGSVTDKVVRSSTRPVLVVPAPH